MRLTKLKVTSWDNQWIYIILEHRELNMGYRRRFQTGSHDVIQLWFQPIKEKHRFQIKRCKFDIWLMKEQRSSETTRVIWRIETNLFSKKRSLRLMRINTKYFANKVKIDDRSIRSLVISFYVTQIFHDANFNCEIIVNLLKLASSC